MNKINRSLLAAASLFVLSTGASAQISTYDEEDNPPARRLDSVDETNERYLGTEPARKNATDAKDELEGRHRESVDPIPVESGKRDVNTKEEGRPE